MLCMATLGGRKRLVDLYDRYVNAPRDYGDFYDAANELMELEVRYPTEQFAKVPAEGPALFVANRSYGVIDGLVLIWLARNARPDVMVLTHKLLCQAPESRKHLLPIDFSGGADAHASNVNSRKQALRQLQEGGAIGVFPAGAVSTSTVPWRGSAVDTAWIPFAAKLPMVSKAQSPRSFFGGPEFPRFSAGESCQLYMAPVASLLGDGQADRQRAGCGHRRSDPI